MAGWDRALVEAARQRSELSDAELAELADSLAPMPVLVLTGEQDRVATSDAAAGLARRLHGARLEVVRECGHLSHEEAPQALAAVLIGFGALALAGGRDSSSGGSGGS